jgi:hypothetical protein
MRRLGLFVLAITALTLAHDAHGGMKELDPVYFYTNGFYGQLGSARSSTDHNQVLSCGMYAYPTSIFMTCGAIDANGVSRGCSATVAPGSPFVAALQSMTANSWIDVSYDSSGTCTMIGVYNLSANYPVQP